MKKIDRRKNYILVLDVETANNTKQPMVYDLGLAVADKKGNIYESKSYVISDIFFDQKNIFENDELMNSSYYAEKLPKYYRGIKNGRDWRVKPLLVARKEILSLMKEYNIKEIAAYNAHFDINALNCTLRYITKSNLRWFFPYGVQVNCIWHMATQTILQQKTFLRIAKREKWETDKGNVKTSAEIAHRYLSSSIEFEEEHTGLQDVIIEVGIMAKCYAQHKKMNKNIYRGCWRLPQKQYKAIS